MDSSVPIFYLDAAGKWVYLEGDDGAPMEPVLIAEVQCKEVTHWGTGIVIRFAHECGFEAKLTVAPECESPFRVGNTYQLGIYGELLGEQPNEDDVEPGVEATWEERALERCIREAPPGAQRIATEGLSVEEVWERFRRSRNANDK